MRALRAFVAALAVIALTACGGAPDTYYTVTGEVGDTPALTFDKALPLDEPRLDTTIEGTGRVIGEDGVALLSISTFSGSDGTPVGPLAQRMLVTLAVGDLDPDLLGLLAQTSEGSRIEATWPVEDAFGSRMEIVIIDVLPTVLTLDPEEIDYGAENLPTIGQDDEGHPTASVSEGVPDPDTLRVVALSKGHGPQVRQGDTVFAQYTLWTWHDGEVFSSTWEEGGVPAAVAIDETFPGLRDGVLDQHVGSRVLVVIPPDLGIGTDSLVAVVDILAIGRDE